MKVIDFRVRLRTKLMLTPWNPQNPAPHFEQYVDLYKMQERLTELPIEAFVNNMNDQGVDQAILCGGSIEENNQLVDIKKGEYSDKFFFCGGVNPSYGINRNLEELNRLVDEGFTGINFSPYIWGVEANHKILYPIYAYCEEKGLIAIIHGSLHYNRYQSMWLGDPRYIDEIAMHFPKLKIVVSHAFNGFGVLGLAVAQRHPNIYLEFSALWPKYLPDTTLKAINSYLRDRCLFGTDYPLVDFSPAITAWEEAIKPEVKDLFFNQNALSCIFG